MNHQQQDNQSSVDQPFISVVSPVYRCDEPLRELVRRLTVALSDMCVAFEIVLVNDGSPDRAWEVIAELAAADRRVKGINLSRNFGQHYAIAAGIDFAQGDWVVVMDCDLQDRPEMIHRLYKHAAQHHYDVVVGWSEFRSRPGRVDRLLSRIYYKIHDLLSGLHGSSVNTSFMVMRRDVAVAYRRLRESRRQHFAVLQYLGFKVGQVDVEHDSRPYGTSSYTLLKRLQLGLFGITATTTRLLRCGIYLGVLFSTGALIATVAIVLIKLFILEFAAGWASVMTAVFFMGGIILVVLGILGVYLETIFHEVKRRPLYVARDLLNIVQQPSQWRSSGSADNRQAVAGSLTSLPDNIMTSANGLSGPDNIVSAIDAEVDSPP